MPIQSVLIPQIGEGLQEARLVAVLKQPGEFVKRDEPIYQMETDKAVMDVESPFEGTLVSWSAEADTILPIGAEICKMDVSVAGASVSPVPVAPATSNMAKLYIPQIGEGLQEARLVAVLKQPGETVKRDEPIYQIETDKAVMDVESPYSGVLDSWVAAVDTVLPIGAEVGTIKTDQAVVDSAPSHGAPSVITSASTASTPSVTSGPRRLDIPPRTRAYAKEKGLTEAQLQTVAAAGSKLMPTDIDTFLAGGTTTIPTNPALKSTELYEEAPMSSAQRILASRLVRGSQLAVPGTITVQTDWEPIEKRRAEYKAAGGDFQPSSFTMFAYAVSRALINHPKFRSSMVGDSNLRTYKNVNIGIAVALPGDQLVHAVVKQAEKLSWIEFAAAVRTKIDEARLGKDQADESLTLSLTNMQAFNLRDAVPVVVPPAVGVLFLGEPYNGLENNTTEIQMKRFVNLALTFDHRVINGVGAAEFLNEIKQNVEQIFSILS